MQPLKSSAAFRQLGEHFADQQSIRKRHYLAVVFIRTGFLGRAVVPCHCADPPVADRKTHRGGCQGFIPSPASHRAPPPQASTSRQGVEERICPWKLSQLHLDHYKSSDTINILGKFARASTPLHQEQVGRESHTWEVCQVSLNFTTASEKTKSAATGFEIPGFPVSLGIAEPIFPEFGMQ